MLKANEYPGEIKRIKNIVENSKSEYLKNDLSKYLERLEREYAEYLEWVSK